MTALALGPGSISAYELDGLLADLELDDATPTAVVMDAEMHAAIETVIDKMEAYEEQEARLVEDVIEPLSETELEQQALAAPTMMVEEEAPAISLVKTPKPAKTGIARITSDLSLLPAEAFRLVMGGTVDEDHKASVIKNRPNQKKVGEKFDNVIGAVAAGKRPSVFVMIAFKVLQAKSEITTADIVAALRTAYTEGTARSQAGQMMELFHALGIGTRDRSRKTLTLNVNSAFAHKLTSLASA